MFNFVSAPRTRLIAQLLAGGVLATILSTAQAQNNFIDDGSVSANAPKVTIHELAPDTLTSWVPDRPTGDDLLPPLDGDGPYTPVTAPLVNPELILGYTAFDAWGVLVPTPEAMEAQNIGNFRLILRFEGSGEGEQRCMHAATGARARF